MALCVVYGAAGRGGGAGGVWGAEGERGTAMERGINGCCTVHRKQGKLITALDRKKGKKYKEEKLW